MNKDTAKDYLPLVQALADGKVIQGFYRKADNSGAWIDIEGHIAFDAPVDQYRIKPEPREIFVVIDNDNDGSHICFYSEEMAIKYSEDKYEVRHYREVIE